MENHVVKILKLNSTCRTVKQVVGIGHHVQLAGHEGVLKVVDAAVYRRKNGGEVRVLKVGEVQVQYWRRLGEHILQSSVQHAQSLRNREDRGHLAIADVEGADLLVGDPIPVADGDLASRPFRREDIHVGLNCRRLQIDQHGVVAHSAIFHV